MGNAMGLQTALYSSNIFPTVPTTLTVGCVRKRTKQITFSGTDTEWRLEGLSAAEEA